MIDFLVESCYAFMLHKLITHAVYTVCICVCKYAGLMYICMCVCVLHILYVSFCLCLQHVCLHVCCTCLNVSVYTRMYQSSVKRPCSDTQSTLGSTYSMENSSAGTAYALYWNTRSTASISSASQRQAQWPAPPWAWTRPCPRRCQWHSMAALTSRNEAVEVWSSSSVRCAICSNATRLERSTATLRHRKLCGWGRNMHHSRLYAECFHPLACLCKSAQVSKQN